MKYYKRQLWKQLNSSNEEEREKAKVKWHKNDAAYAKVYKVISKAFPADFIRAYSSHKGFHDYCILSFDLSLAEKSCTIILTKGKSVICLTLKELKKCKLRLMQDLTSFVPLTWGFAELGKKGKTYLLALIMDFDNEVYFEFGGITAQVQPGSS